MSATPWRSTADGGIDKSGDLDLQCADRDGDRNDQDRDRPDRLHRQRFAEAGQQFRWDGHDNSGTQWPAGNYTMSITGKDAAAIRSRSRARSRAWSIVDLTKTPPELSVGGQQFTIDKIKRVVRPTAA